MRILVFGDSITQGFWDTEGGWAARLRKHYDKIQLKNLVNNHEPSIFNLGINGDVAPGIIKRFEAEREARRSRWPTERFTFIFAIGTNDSMIEDGKSRFSESKYQKNLEYIVGQAKKHSEKIMLVGLTACDEKLTAPVFWKDICYTNERLKIFEEIMRKVAKDNKISFVPVFNEFKKHLDAQENLLADGLHPNNEGHEFIFQLVLPELDKLINT